MKALFLIFHGFGETSGISKKILYQVKALKECGLDIRTCYYDISPDGNRRWMVDDKTLTNLGYGMSAKFRKRYDYKAISDYVLHENIGFVYIRSYHNANPFTIHMVKRMRKYGAKVVMEIPTFPYDQEYTTHHRLHLTIDRCFRNHLAAALNGIVTFSNESKIFGKQTIRISNGIDFEAIPMKKQVNNTSQEMHLLGVAEVHYWHGFDRLIHGLAEYYKTNPEYKIYFHIVGPLIGKREREEILPVIHENHLEDYVLLYGPLHGKKLDELFEKADLAIGSLGRHRSGIKYIKTLKNREYAARGLAFIYSETDEDFDKMPYVWKVLPDESPIDINKLIDFQHQLTMSPQEIRETVRPLSWTSQMQKVIDALKFKI